MHLFIIYFVFAALIILSLLFNKKYSNKLFFGNILKDYGSIEGREKGIINVKISLLLTERDGVKKIVIKEDFSALLSSRFTYFEIDMDSACKLRDSLNEALKG